jgi:uncharacterized membrane protein YtjA (UPF0391 family)
MLYYALSFLIVGLVAGVLGLYGVTGVASQIAWILFVIARADGDPLRHGAAHPNPLTGKKGRSDESRST